ncbi:hypothetical protein WBQ88_09700 [Sphingopyxis sp. CCNWLW253]|uniref:hypothetical protein n=1 Tax=unclassified Sphingopyxis TaxID=2614943 RepID=UPI0030130619
MGAMSRYQISLSTVCLLVVATGLYLIAQNVAGGSAPAAWGLFCLLVCLALVIQKIIDRLPMSHEAIFRATNAKPWPELSTAQRHCLVLFDWPLFMAIRYREVERLGTETSFRFTRAGNGITLQPAGEQHIERYFLGTIASGLARYGLRVQLPGRGWDLFNRKGAELKLVGDDGRIIQYICGKFENGDLISLRNFGEAAEAGYISTLPEIERDAYVMAMR